MIKSVYIHVPFCKSICSYCDFCKLYYDKKFVSIYLDALEKEINDFYLGEVVDTIYVGGGTPSSLSPEELDRFLNIIKVIKRSSNYEFTFECNPEDIDDILLSKLSRFGVNRISMGVESFNKDNLKFLKRKADFDDIKKKMDLIKYYGINNINLDLMYALKGETLEVLKKDVKLFLKLKPEHISTYSLIIENHTMINNDNISYISEDLDAKMYDYICKKLKRKGYNHYEVSNFALSNYKSRHNLCYWNNEEYYGFGLGASGYVNGFRYDNTKSLTEYEKGNYHHKESLLSQKEVMEYELMLGLRKLEGISLEEFYDKYGINMQDVFPIKPLIREKELIYKNGRIFINPNKIYVMNEILLKLI